MMLVGSVSMIIMFITILVFVIIMVMVFKGVSEWHNNNRHDIETFKAAVVAKRQDFSHSSNTSSTHSTYYYVTFQDEQGVRIELAVSGRDYGLMAEGDRGVLSCQGTRFKGFERSR